MTRPRMYGIIWRLQTRMIRIHPPRQIKPAIKLIAGFIVALFVMYIKKTGQIFREIFVVT